MAIELEAKFAAPNAAALQGLPEILAGLEFSIATTFTRHDVDTYLDSQDWKIYHGGYAYRVRQRDERVIVCLKSLDAPRGGVAEREEIEAELAQPLAYIRQLPGTPVGDKLRALLQGAELRPLFRVEQQRTVCRAEDPTGLRIEASADRIRYHAVGRRSGEYLVELERIEGERERFERLVADFHRVTSWAMLRSSKFESGLQLAQLHP